jgi:hypothetical protein
MLEMVLIVTASCWLCVSVSHDTMQNDIMKAVLSANPSMAVMASEEDDAAIPCNTSSSSNSGGYAVVFDPLDGSRNIDAAIPTGAGGMHESGNVACMQSHVWALASTEIIYTDWILAML